MHVRLSLKPASWRWYPRCYISTKANQDKLCSSGPPWLFLAVLDGEYKLNSYWHTLLLRSFWCPCGGVYSTTSATPHSRGLTLQSRTVKVRKTESGVHFEASQFTNKKIWRRDWKSSGWNLSQAWGYWRRTGPSALRETERCPALHLQEHSSMGRDRICGLSVLEIHRQVGKLPCHLFSAKSCQYYLGHYQPMPAMGKGKVTPIA